MVSGPTNIATEINAVATVVLVLVTAAYVFLTWGMVKETRQAREQEVMPVMNLDVEPISISSFAPKVENVGNGPALDVSATVELIPDGGEHEILSKNIASGDFTGSMEPTVDQDSHEQYDSLVVKGEYTNVFGQRSSFKESYDLELLSKQDAAESMMKQDRKRRLLRSIDDSLESIARNIQMDGLEEAIKMESRGRILSIIEETGPLTVEELSKKTGMTSFELAENLIYLHESGAVESDVEPREIFKEENLQVEIRSQAYGNENIE